MADFVEAYHVETGKKLAHRVPRHLTEGALGALTGLALTPSSRDAAQAVSAPVAEPSPVEVAEESPTEQED